MTATILKFTPRPNPKREAEQLAQAVVNAMCWPWLAWADTLEAADLAYRAAALKVAGEYAYCAPDDDCA